MPKSNVPFAELSKSGRFRLLRALNQRHNGGNAELLENPAPPRDAGARAVDGREEAQIRQQENHIVQEPVIDPPEQNREIDEDGFGDEAEENDGNNTESESDNPSDSDSDDDSVDGRDEEFYRFANRPAYTGAPLTVMESMSLIMTLMLKHNLTATSISDIIAVIQLHCLRAGLVKLSLHKLQKYFCSAKAPVKKKYYCMKCQNNLISPQQVCQSCQRREEAAYFIQFPLVPQLKVMFKRRDFYENLQHRFTRGVIEEGVMQDIYDGRLYKEHIGNGFLANPNNISFFWSADGVPVYSSKNFSFWGFYLMINELPYKTRTARENILMAGLWFGPSKPNINSFIQAFVPDFEKLYTGVSIQASGQIQPIIVRGILLGGVGDYPAKTTFLNCKAHNGFFGCCVCEIPGETVRLPSGSDTHAYRYEPFHVKRTVERMVAQARRALEINEPFTGVKGPCALRLIMPDYVRGMGIDTMHLIEGLMHKLFMLHFDSKFSASPFSLRPVINVVDEMLLKIKPPKFIHRMPRSVEAACHWKASEFKAWLFYYSVPILQVVMNPRYFDHYLKLVIGLSYLCASKVTLGMVNSARELLHEFVREFENLYGLQHCSINIHSLLHLPDACLELGPCWVSSCFPLENMYGQTLQNIHGTTNMDSQVYNSHWQLLALHTNLHELHDGPVKEFCLQPRGKLKIFERLLESCYAIGSYLRTENYHPVVQTGLQNLDVGEAQVRLFHRLLKDGLVYVAEMYNRNLKSSSSFISYRKNNTLAFGSVFTFVNIVRCQCNIDCHCPSESFAIVKEVQRMESFAARNHLGCPLHHIQRCQMTLRVLAVPIRDLKSVCFYIPINDSFFVSEPVNLEEVE